jgi:hypothetical protein
MVEVKGLGHPPPPPPTLPHAFISSAGIEPPSSLRHNRNATPLHTRPNSLDAPKPRPTPNESPFRMRGLLSTRRIAARSLPPQSFGTESRPLNPLYSDKHPSDIFILYLAVYKSPRIYKRRVVRTSNLVAEQVLNRSSYTRNDNYDG